ncbi:MAG: hypothetical protein U0350_51000 [Caldilineaceae bacterium]
MGNAEGLLFKKCFEYRLETVQLLHKQEDEQALVACLNEWGKEGWLLCQIDLAVLHAPHANAIKVLLVRSLSEPVYTELDTSNDDDDDDFDDD